MRSLSAIRSRVDRLSFASGGDAPPMFVSWVHAYERCPTCGADLAALEHAATEAELHADRARGTVKVIYWVDELMTCPRCQAPLLT